MDYEQALSLLFYLCRAYFISVYFIVRTYCRISIHYSRFHQNGFTLSGCTSATYTFCSRVDCFNSYRWYLLLSGRKNQHQKRTAAHFWILCLPVLELLFLICLKTLRVRNTLNFKLLFSCSFRMDFIWHQLF